jgi:hypothetical protein
MEAELFDLHAHQKDLNNLLRTLDAFVAEIDKPTTPDLDPDYHDFLLQKRASLAALRGLYKARPYFDKIDYCERLINYLVAYACKGEISARDAAAMFRNIATSELPDDTPVASLARKLALKVLKARECPRPEIAHTLQRLPLYRSSLQVFIFLSHFFTTFLIISHASQPVHVDLAFKRREVQIPDERDHAEDEPVRLRQSAFDKFLNAQNNEVNPPTLSS